MSFNRAYINDKLPPADFFNFSSTVISSSAMIFSSANFFRTASNSNIELTIPSGVDISPGTIWISPNIYLPNNVFNSIKSIDEIIYSNNKDARILVDLTFMHDILIQYKMTKFDGSNFINNRELRCTLVREDGTTQYEQSLYSNQQPDSGSHDYVLLRGHLLHNLNDLVKIKLNIVQDNNRSDFSDTRITIFRVSWNLMALKQEKQE